MNITSNDIVINQYDEKCITILQCMNGKYFLSQGGIDLIEFMLEVIILKGKKVLDVGSGLGGPAFYLAQEHKAQVHGIDVDPFLVKQSLEERDKRELQEKVTFNVITSYVMPFDDATFDVVFSKEVIVHVKDKKALFQELYRVLKPGGIVVILDWFKETEGYSKNLLNQRKATCFSARMQS